jgi:hypothetical protein
MEHSFIPPKQLHANPNLLDEPMEARGISCVRAGKMNTPLETIFHDPRLMR